MYIYIQYIYIYIHIHIYIYIYLEPGTLTIFWWRPVLVQNAQKTLKRLEMLYEALGTSSCAAKCGHLLRPLPLKKVGTLMKIVCATCRHHSALVIPT